MRVKQRKQAGAPVSQVCSMAGHVSASLECPTINLHMMMEHALLSNMGHMGFIYVIFIPDGLPDASPLIVIVLKTIGL